jgi:type II secretory pathway component GspD/PulD (secretin)
MSARLVTLFEDAKVIPDVRLNALIIHGTKEQLETMTALAQRLDEAPDPKK